MINLSKYFILIAFSVLSFFGALANDEKRKVALHLYLYDEAAINLEHKTFYEELFQKIHPDVVFKRVEVSLLDGEDLAFERVRRKLRSIITDNEVIDFLIVDTHGNSGKIGQWSYTKLKGLGVFNSNNVGGNLGQNLLSIKNKTTRSLKIYLNACKTFCGEHDEIVKRSRSLLNYFQAYDGSIYGANTTEVSDIYTSLKYYDWKYLKPGTKTLTITALVTAVWAAGNILWLSAFYDLSLQQTLLDTFISSVGYSSWLLAVSYLSKFMSSKKGNRGFYLKFKNGQLHKFWKVNKFKELHELLSEKLKSIACSYQYLK